MKRLQTQWFNDVRNKNIIYSPTKDGRLYKIDESGNAVLIARKTSKKIGYQSRNVEFRVN